jgi:membrane-bound lytic murein transglycosylase D
VVAEVAPTPVAETPVETPPAPVETTVEVTPTPVETVSEPAAETPPADAVPAPMEASAPQPTTTPEASETPAPIEETTVSVQAPAATPPVEIPPAIPREHTIVKGDSLNALAKQFGIAVSDLRAWNNMESDVIKIGQVIKLEAPIAEGAQPETAPEPVPDATPEVEPALAEPATEATPAPEPTPDPAPEAAPASEGSTPEEMPAEAAPETPESAEAAPAIPASAEVPVVTQPANTDKREHTVAVGETLGSIAGMYGVSVADVQAWNGLDAGETVINAGASLVVYLPMAAPDEEPATPEVVGSTTPEAPPAAPSASPENKENVKPAHVEPRPGTYDIHEVAAGDNLRRIAQRYGTTQQKLVEMNGLESADLVQIGWKLKVPKQAAAPEPAPATAETP